MAEFKYTARDKAGKQLTGTVDAADRNGAVEKITAQGLYPVKVSGAGEGSSSTPVTISDETPRPKGRAKPKLRDLANYTRQLANLLKAGMPITASLSSMINLESGGIPSTVSEALLHDVREGRNLSAAMGAHPDIFPDMYINMVRAGESGGSLVEVLLRLAEHYERFAEVRQKVAEATLRSSAQYL